MWPALARLIALASERTQLVVVSHSPVLIAAIENATVLELVKESGQTMLVGQGRLDEPSWNWPSR